MGNQIQSHHARTSPAVLSWEDLHTAAQEADGKKEKGVWAPKTHHRQIGKKKSPALLVASAPVACVFFSEDKKYTRGTLVGLATALYPFSARNLRVGAWISPFSPDSP